MISTPNKSPVILLVMLFPLVVFTVSAGSPVFTATTSTGENESSLRWYDEVLASEPGNETALIGKTVTLAALSRWNEALNVISASGLDTPDNPKVCAIRAEGYEKTGKADDALQYLDVHPEIPEKDDLRIRAASLLDLGKDKEALALLQKGEGKGFADPRLSLLMGTVLTREGQISAAIPYLETAFAGLPADPGAALAMSKAIASRGLYEEALIFADEATRRDPANPEYWYTVSYILDRLERYNESLDALDHASSLDPSDPEQLNDRAYTLYLAGRSGEAQAIAQEALEKNPGDPAVLDTLGSVLLAEGEADEAVGYLERAEASLPGDPEVLAHLGDAYHMLGQESRAQDKYQRSLEIDPDQGLAWKGYSAVLLSLERYPEAAEAIAQAYRFSPGDPDLISWEKEADKVLLDWYLKEESGKKTG